MFKVKRRRSSKAASRGAGGGGTGNDSLRGGENGSDGGSSQQSSLLLKSCLRSGLAAAAGNNSTTGNSSNGAATPDASNKSNCSQLSGAGSVNDGTTTLQSGGSYMTGSAADLLECGTLSSYATSTNNGCGRSRTSRSVRFKHIQMREYERVLGGKRVALAFNSPKTTKKMQSKISRATTQIIIIIICF